MRAGSRSTSAKAFSRKDMTCAPTARLPTPSRGTWHCCTRRSGRRRSGCPIMPATWPATARWRRPPDMSIGANAIRQVVVAGGGIVGWSAAVALKRRLPGLRVTVVPVPPPADALADRIASTLPSILEFHRDIGLTDADAIVRAGSSFRLGTCFDGWAEGLPPYVHAYGEYGRPFGTASFHLHWIRAAHRGAASPFDGHSPAAAIARAGRFVQPQGEQGSPLASFEYGLQLNLPRYREMMRAYARHLGVTERQAGIAEVRLRGEDGFITTLRLDDGSEIGGHLFVDCTGPRALLRSALDRDFEAWDRWL